MNSYPKEELRKVVYLLQDMGVPEDWIKAMISPLGNRREDLEHLYEDLKNMEPGDDPTVWIGKYLVPVLTDGKMTIPGFDADGNRVKRTDTED